MFLRKNRFCSIQNTQNLCNLCETSRKQKETTVGDIANLKKDSIFLANANVYSLISPRFRLKVAILREPFVFFINANVYSLIPLRFRLKVGILRKPSFYSYSSFAEVLRKTPSCLIVSHLYRMESTYECVSGVNQSKCLKSKCTGRGKVKHELRVTSSNR